jgi:hypothetical protein
MMVASCASVRFPTALAAVIAHTCEFEPLELPPLEPPPLELFPLPELLETVLPPLEPVFMSLAVTPFSNRTQDAAAAKPKEETAAQPNTYFRREPEKTASVMMQRLSWARRGDALFENVGPSFTNEKTFVVERDVPYRIGFFLSCSQLAKGVA